MEVDRIFLIVLYFLFFSATFGNSESEVGESECSSRCHRLLSRSLSKINYSVKKVDNLLKSNQKVKDLGDVCWKFYDYYDCEKQCEKRSKKALSRLDVLTRLVVKRCKFVDEDYSTNIRCIHKYHSFIEVRCSSYMNEAVRLRKLVEEAENDKDKKGKVQETCRFLHYHNMCLSNTVFFYCPNAKKLFNRFTLRNYFLSFVVPEDDESFNDKFLDYCEVFDFQKMAKEVYDTTSSVKIEKWENLKPTTPVSVVKLIDENKSVETSKEKKVFSSEEDLQDTPPNFFYSSARYETTTYKPASISKEKPKSKSPVPPSGKLWSPKPVTIEFVSHPIEPSPEPESSFTLDPNEILSTIFKFPSIFPTTVTDPDPTTVQAKTGDMVNVGPGSGEDDLYDDFGIDPEYKSSATSFENAEVIWRSKPPMKTTTESPEKGIENQESEESEEQKDESMGEKDELDERKEPKGKTTIVAKVYIETTTPDKQPEAVNSKEKSQVVTALPSKNSTEYSEEPEHTSPPYSGEILPNKSSEFRKPNSTEKLIEITDTTQNQGEEETSTLSVSTYSEPNLDSSEKKATVAFELPSNMKPLLSGTKVHIKRIRHYSELATDKDYSEEEEGEDGPVFRPRAGGIKNKETSNVNAVFANNKKSGAASELLSKRPVQPSSRVTSGKSKTFWNSVVKSENEYDQSKFNETIDPQVDSSLLDQFNEEFADLATLKWFLILYSVIFLLAFIVLFYLIISIISKRCKKHRKDSFSS